MKDLNGRHRRRRIKALVAFSAILFLSTGSGPAALAAEDELLFHEPLRVRKKKVFVGRGDEAQELGNASEYCLECHGGPSASIGHADQNHPVEIIYPRAEPGYVKRKSLDRRLLLIDGRLSCVTCHDAESPDHALVLPTGADGLCTACHRQ